MGKSEKSDLYSSDTLRELRVGDVVFGRYCVTQYLGAGAMGIVWLVRDQALDRDLALKFLPFPACTDAEAVRALREETNRSMDLNHPHIVRVHTFLQNEQQAAIAMEFIPGENLSDLRRIAPQGCFAVDEIEGLMCQLLDAMRYAHTRARMVHRDLKPGNMRVSGEDGLKVMDFGTARTIASAASRTKGSRFLTGTIAYMSPQQLLGGPPSVSDDIYAIGASVYDLLTGGPPFVEGDLRKQILEVVPPAMGRMRADRGRSGSAIAPVWEKVVGACLEKESADRPKSMEEIARSLGLPLPDLDQQIHGFKKLGIDPQVTVRRADSTGLREEGKGNVGLVEPAGTGEDSSKTATSGTKRKRAPRKVSSGRKAEDTAAQSLTASSSHVLVRKGAEGGGTSGTNTDLESKVDAPAEPKTQRIPLPALPVTAGQKGPGPPVPAPTERRPPDASGSTGAGSATAAPIVPLVAGREVKRVPEPAPPAESSMGAVVGPSAAEKAVAPVVTPVDKLKSAGGAPENTSERVAESKPANVPPAMVKPQPNVVPRGPAPPAVTVRPPAVPVGMPKSGAEVPDKTPERVAESKPANVPPAMVKPQPNVVPRGPAPPAVTVRVAKAEARPIGVAWPATRPVAPWWRRRGVAIAVACLAVAACVLFFLQSGRSKDDEAGVAVSRDMEGMPGAGAPPVHIAGPPDNREERVLRRREAVTLPPGRSVGESYGWKPAEIQSPGAAPAPRAEVVMQPAPVITPAAPEVSRGGSAGVSGLTAEPGANVPRAIPVFPVGGGAGDVSSLTAGASQSGEVGTEPGMSVGADIVTEPSGSGRVGRVIVGPPGIDEAMAAEVSDASDFARDFFLAPNVNPMEQLKHYAPQVQYFRRGVGVDAVESNLRKYAKDWPVQQWSVEDLMVWRMAPWRYAADAHLQFVHRNARRQDADEARTHVRFGKESGTDPWRVDLFEPIGGDEKVPAFSMGETRQLIVGMAEDWDGTKVVLRRWVRMEKGWVIEGDEWAAMLGCRGLAWGIGRHPVKMKGPEKEEGDGRTPAGIFELGECLGYATEVAGGTRWPYVYMQGRDLWITDSTRKGYNQRVRVPDGRDLTEEEKNFLMTMDDPQLRLKIAIRHNPGPGATPNRGSAIFLQIWREEGGCAVPTVGSVSMPAERLEGLVRWLDPAAKPLFVLLPRPVYNAVRAKWQLPPDPAR